MPPSFGFLPLWALGTWCRTLLLHRPRATLLRPWFVRAQTFLEPLKILACGRFGVLHDGVDQVIKLVHSLLLAAGILFFGRSDREKLSTEAVAYGDVHLVEIWSAAKVTANGASDADEPLSQDANFGAADSEIVVPEWLFAAVLLDDAQEIPHPDNRP